MGDANNIGKIELLLKKKTTARPSALYKTSNLNKTTLKPQDILHRVYTQIKTIQMADGRSSKYVGKELNKVNSSFLAVNKLPLYNEAKQTNTFETQCVSDTQLINITEDAEAFIDTHKGMTQEFDTDFTQTNIENKDSTLMLTQKIDNENMPEAQEFETTFTQTNVDKTVSFLEDKVEIEGNNTHLEKREIATDVYKMKDVDKLKEMCGKVLEKNQSVAKMVCNDKLSVGTQREVSCNLSFIHDNTVPKDTKPDKKNNSQFDNIIKKNASMDFDEDEDRPPSPILKITSKTIPSPMVFPLESFERFERIAIPLMDSNKDLDLCKHLINSQILGGELYLNTVDDVMINETGQLSPIIEKSCEIFHDNTEDSIKKNMNINSRDKESDSLKDEILFSSDEENDYIYRNFQEMPLTAALETSFYDYSNVLEKTMYACFQTASNKSIKIPTDLFQKAQFILNEDDNINGKDLSLADLVDIYDDKNFNNVSSTDLKTKNEVNPGAKSVEAKAVVNIDSNMTQAELEKYDSNKDVEIIDDVKIKIFTEGYDDTIKKPPEKEYFVGFKTASNRKINLSDKAFDHSKKVFKDIDFDENLDVINKNDIKTVDDSSTVMIEDIKPDKNENDIDNKIYDDLLIQEFENIEMSLEEKENCYDENKTDNFQSVVTICNKNINVCDVAKEKTEDAFQDFYIRDTDDNYEKYYTVSKKNAETAPKTHQSRIIESEDNSESKTFIGFKTANNKNIEISAQALANTKIVFQDIGKTKNKAVDNSQPSTSKAAFMGFKTANNRDIKISQVALSRSSKMLNEINKENSKLYENEAEMETLFKNLKTVNNKSVNTSEQALIKSKTIFKDMEINSENTIKSSSICKNSASLNHFQTDNNKTVVISEECTAKNKNSVEDLKSRAMLSLDDHQLTFHEPKDYIPTFKGFETASKKPVSVSANALGKKIFQDINNSIESKTKPKTYLESKFKGFQTASNKEVRVAKEAIDASKKLLDELKLDTSVFCAGFKTASNKNVNVFEEAIAKCQKIFDDIGDVPTEALRTKEILNEPIVYQTANNKQVELSKDALAKTKNLFNYVEMPEIVDQRTFKGFQTASKKKVVVSKEAIEKSKALFNDIEETRLKEPFTGFQTANKKKVEVSKEAIEKTKDLFNDLAVPDIKNEPFKGFQTASKKKVHVSEKALAKTKQIFKDIDSHANVVNDTSKEKQTNNSKLSFQTGNNENVNVSNDALKESKKLFKDSKDNTTKSSAYDVILDRNNISDQKELKTDQKELKIDSVVNLDIINTQVLNNFEESLCTEDFKEKPRNKRSGSPILSCPKAKRKKRFETPYKDEKSNKTEDIKKNPDDKKFVCTTNIKFTENYKKNRTYTLKDLCKFANVDKKGITCIITCIAKLNINLDNILSFEFIGQRNDVTDSIMNVEELKKVFLSAVNSNLVPEGWLDNHLKLILWKLISYEIKLCCKSFLCTVQNVIDQLKYRYDKELYNAERPVLRKILERDDVPAKTMVLCVAGFYVDGVSVSSVTNTTDVELLLTDGWYFIKATIDKMLSKLVYESRIVIGCKIITSGAELVNCDQGIAHWEDTSAIRLKIFGNSTRPAPWDAILGYSRAAILNQLSTVKVDGGKISRLRAFVTRVYPLLYVEKFEDGSTVTRSERLEHLHQIKYEAERELMMERIYEEVQKEFSDQESQDSEILDSGKRRYCDSGSQIAKMMKVSKDPMEFRAQLTTSQVHLLQEHTCKYREKVIQAIQDRVQEKIRTRNVVTLARGRIASLNNKKELTKGMLSIWKPNDAILEIFKEGSWIDVMNTMPTAVRYSEIQITAGRQSVFRATKSKNEVSPTLQSLKRTCFKISDVTQNPTMTTHYSEIDTVGVVFLIEPNNREFESSRNFQNVYLADADKNIISVIFWGGIKKFGFENILDIGQVVACANLQKRAGNTGKNIPQFRVTEFSNFTKTPRNVQARAMVDELDKKLFGLDRRKFCDDCVAIKKNYAALRCNSENESPYRFPKGDYSFGRNKMFIDTPLGVKANKKEDLNFNLTGLDFESSFKQDTPELSPRTLLRKKKVCEKIAKLKLYGEPPPLSPINIIDKSVNAKSSYKSPLVSSNSIVVTLNNLPTNSVSISNTEESPKTIPRFVDREKSPVISMKRSVPVKLNFANDNNLVDHFAGEFDGSPPLSLD